MENLEVDILILGGGGAGLFCALHAYKRDPKLKIALVAKGLIGQSGCTRMVQGGYNAVLDPQDSLDLHFQDTLKGGGFINDQDLAWVLVEDAPKIIAELERMGCFFDRTPEGYIYQKPFAGQAFDRTVHRGDLTGIEIMARLKEQLLATEVMCLDEHRAIEIITDDSGRAAGSLLLDIPRGQFISVAARALVVATGGGARMYKIAAPSLEKAGDGMAMCYRAGCVMLDMEMYQFHPTGLMVGDAVLTGSVLEEGLRGAGGMLYNALGERYMQRYDPQRIERSTRDVVSRASYMEIIAGRGGPRGGVLLDVSHLGADFIQKNFPGMADRCLEAGFDLKRGPVEVSPTAHFHMGGAKIDTWCRTNIEGLFVAGEDAGGVHGANRLGGNGVAESTVFGARAGEVVVDYLQGAGRSHKSWSESGVQEVADSTLEPFGRSEGETPWQLRRELEELMWQKVGLVRDGRGLSEALEWMAKLEERIQRVSVPGGRGYNQPWQDFLNLRSLVTVARLTAISAQARTESRGSHYRSDFPDRDDASWLKNVYIRAGVDGNPAVWSESVRFNRLEPDS